jgi:uncharacterized membrane protein YphA (DoxX/SURF4 family)
MEMSSRLDAGSTTGFSRPFLHLILHVASGLWIGAGGVRLLLPLTVTPPPGATTVPVIWMPASSPGLRLVHGVVAVLLGGLLVFGFQTQRAARAGLAFLTVVAVEQLVPNPFYNLLSHILPLFFMLAMVLWLGETENHFSVDRWFGLIAKTRGPGGHDWTVLMLRLILGSVFLRQGLNSVLKYGLVGFAQKVYVDPFASKGIPKLLLWLAGVTNPPIQVLGGLALILGLRTRWAAVGVTIFLMEILFGHMLDDPLDLSGDLHSYALANLALALFIIGLEPGGDRFSLDRLWSGFRSKA